MSEVKVNKISPRSGTTVTLGDSGDTFTLASGVSLTGVNATFSGDLTVDTNTLKVDSTNNRVGIGTASPSEKLFIKDNGNTRIEVKSTGSTTATSIGTINNAGSLGRILMYSTGIGAYGSLGAGEVAFYSNTAGMSIMNDNASGVIKFSMQSGAEKMRIESDGDVLIAKTSNSLGTVGIELASNGKVSATRSADPAMSLNRLSTDGQILDFRKDTTTVGSIGSNNGVRLGIGTSDTGIKFWEGDGILPANPASTFADRDNAIDLGYSSNRFKDLYLGGNIYLGGTGSANALDDYEEGTWTPAFSRASSAPTVTHSRQTGTYSKIGQTVIAFFDMVVDSYSGGGGDYRMVGLPFATNMSISNGGFSRSVIRAATLMSTDFRVNGDSSFVNASNVTLKNYNSSGGEVAVSPSSSGRLTGYIIYTTSS